MSAGSNWFDDAMTDTYRIAAPSGQSASGALSGAPASAPDPRRPCPMCGEMIVIGAAKCRFCDAIFDENLRRSEKKRKRRRGGSTSDYDDDLSVGDWVVCILCPLIGLIGGVIYLLTGKSKGWKVLGVSFIVTMVTGLVRLAIVASQNPHGLR